MCKRFLCMLFLLGSTSLFYQINAQNVKPPCVVKGIIRNQTNAPLPGATVYFINANDTTKVYTVITNTDGTFMVDTDCSEGSINVTMAGYEAYVSQNLTPKENELIKIELKTKYQGLAAVEVRAARRNIEVRNDRMIVNVEASSTNAGTNALDLLEKSPGITVDQDGNISMQGRQGVMLLIDGKRNQLNNTELAALLRSLSSSQIDQIELISQPSAKYDASGNAGVINIKMKRNRVARFNGNLTTSITQGKYTRFNQSLVIDQRIGKAVFSLGYNGAYHKGFFDFTIIRKFSNNVNGDADKFEQRTINPFLQIPHNIRFSIDYPLSPKSSLTVNNTVFISRYKDAPATTSFNEIDNNKSLDQSIGANKIKRMNYAIGMNWRKQIDSIGKELTVDGEFFSYDRKNNQALYSEQFNEQGNRIDEPYHIKGYNPSIIQIVAGKLDYFHPFNKEWKAEMGIKLSHVTTENNAGFSREVNGNWSPDTRGNDFDYSERIMGSYINLLGSLKSWKLQAGLRAEATTVHAKESVQAHNKKTGYIDLFPSVSINYEKKKGQVYTIYYNRRIDRPNYQDLNPFQFVFNRYTYMQGNPGLIPQYSNLIEIGYAYKSNFNLKASYSYTKDIIGDALIQDDVIRVTFQQKINMAKRNVASLNSTLVIPVSKTWSTTVFGNLFYTSFIGRFKNENLQHDAFSFNFNINNQFRFAKGWTAELSGSYSHKNYFTALFFVQGITMINAGVSKQIIGGKGTLRLAARDILRAQYNRYVVDFSTMDIRFKQRQDVSNITVAFSYRFGKSSANQRRRSSSASEEMNRVGTN